MTAAYLHRRVPHKALNGKTPHEVLNGHAAAQVLPPPPLHHLRRFGCRAYKHIPEEQRSDKMLGERSKPAMMVGYVHHTTSMWKLYDPFFKKVIHCSDVDLDEEVNCYTSCPTPAAAAGSTNDPFGLPQKEPIHIEYYEETTGREAEEITDRKADVCSPRSRDAERKVPRITSWKADAGKMAEDPPNTREDEHIVRKHNFRPRNEASTSQTGTPDEATIQTPGKGKRKRSVSIPSVPMVTRRMARASAKQKSPQALMAEAMNIIRFGGDPLTVAEALHQENPKRREWQAAMQEEWDSIRLNNTFYPFSDTASPTGSTKPISSKWVFKAKQNSDGSTRDTARLVIRGFEQVEGVDFNDTYAPVGKLTTLRYLLSLSAQNGWQIDHLDVVTAFLNPEVDSDVYMALPEGIDWLDPKLYAAARHVKLRKALYGLKQAPKIWHEAINRFLLSLGFKPTQADPNIYINGDVLILLYVDDILLCYPDEAMDAAQRVKQALMKQYKMKVLDAAQQFLGLEISRRSDGTISLGQQAYVNTILKRFDMLDARAAYTLLDPNVKLDRADEREEENAADAAKYQAIVGSLMYAALGTRPDIAYAVAALCRYNARLLSTHMTAAIRVLRYLKTTHTTSFITATILATISMATPTQIGPETPRIDDRKVDSSTK
jgi:hypothetical protein